MPSQLSILGAFKRCRKWTIGIDQWTELCEGPSYMKKKVGM
jgi:hypothetical protein